MFLISGAVGTIALFLAPTAGSFLWCLLTTALSLLVGVLLLWHPVEGAASLTLVLVAFFLVEGVFHIVLSFGNRELFPQSWGWILMSGIADLILVAIIMDGWPGSAGWALGVIVGANVRRGVTRRGVRDVTAAESEGIGRAGGPLLRSSLVVLGKGGCYDRNGRQRCDTSAGEF